MAAPLLVPLVPYSRRVTRSGRLNPVAYEAFLRVLGLGQERDTEQGGTCRIARFRWSS
ncbi:hypothetical protein [Streptomyces sp. enrichment culture]|uniref:hypothetical protein n=1 Tax=Streptomyces sp. enrichment culture TaxID=1795815 RepID=UPI003F5797B3